MLKSYTLPIKKINIMSEEVKKYETQGEIVLSNEQLANYLDLYGYSNLEEKEKVRFIEVCKMAKLNPFQREAHISAYGSGEYRQFAIITGYETYIRRAEDTGLVRGWHVETSVCDTVKTDIQGNLKTIKDLQATITIYRADYDFPFTHTVKFSEYVQKTKKEERVTAFWLKPESQLKKVAIGQGFRLCFSKELSYLPYTREETIESSYKDITATTEQKPIEKKLNELVEGSETWNKVVEKLLKGTAIDKVKEYYTISPELEEKLNSIIEEETERIMNEESKNFEK